MSGKWEIPVYHGPSCIPAHTMGGTDMHASSGHYGRYLALDLTANNVHSIDAWCARNPGKPRPDFGWGVCRHGFGLQDHKGILTQAAAEEWATKLNAAIPIGVDPRSLKAS